ncbi:zinc finger and SCAN domain-containing protein 26-like isoform X8 [Leptidea sinapis]|uniref:zinc finger and SCAN domain-containing protein 26-like isoform X8 n=1 Tax=Leptidea sinapis TaxID=189913 RepID=UPI0021C41453|nr:zinc finger and SCAN domain-containing protein 26-like isoform X8 [Leptidea sinapis]
MDFEDVIVKESPGVCRCCLSEGCYKDLGSEYLWMEETEVYADMLLECFDISISQHSDGPNGMSRLICEVCVTRLRDACNFKKQVLQSEKRFIDMVARGDFENKDTACEDNIKLDHNEEPMDSADVDYFDEGIDFDGGNNESEEIAVEPIKIRSKPGRPKRNAKVDKKSNEATPSASKTVAKGTRAGQDSRNAITEAFNGFPATSQRKSDLTVKEKRCAMRNNVIQVLIKSTVMPFRWLKSSYRCFYCYDIFQEPSELKDHQQIHSGDDVKVNAMNKYWEPVVYIDISNLTCKLCPENISDLYDLIDHLVEKHGVAYNKDIGLCMIPFKLDNLSLNCLTCGAIFYTFGPLLHHTNKDHKGVSAILCDVCGQHFKDANLLKLHMKTVHENNGLLCQDCGDKFESRYKLKSHQKYEHNVDKKYKCMECPQMFQSHYKRSRHMAVEHKTREEVKCPHCPKTFVFRSMMMTHLRDTHLKVRNYICSVCGWKAFNSNRLKNHMFKHSGEKNFKCDVCEKMFSTRKIMRAHFIRMHKSIQSQPVPYDPYGD